MPATHAPSNARVQNSVARDGSVRKSRQGSRGAGRGRGQANGGRADAAGPKGEVVTTRAFDSVGPRKYALQIRRASNGNPCLKIVEGVPQGDGTFRKFHLTVWSEDFERFFGALDEMRAYIAEHNIKTPDGHKYDPDKKPRRKKT